MLESRFPSIISRAGAVMTLATERTAARIERGCKKRSRVDTGNMRGGWQQQREGPFQITVFNPVNYTIHNEFGTIHMSAQPMLRPSIEEARPTFHKEVLGAYK